ncbi:Adenylosuccinate synthetase [Delftia sp. Cs1-4]|uniref:adenylosuccinate synthetase n=1 Tax=Delftia sp. (strain Cs1-4) TaxID=742013 RepID=UPI00020E86EB|nr:adenylosuccinate synthetase [Delftia sp. Cs1-4]AEF91096.1 Adenylosuccinate synthetase [Delftia sp. Cs1-4]
MDQVVLISGHLGAGKSGLAQMLESEFDYHRFSSSAYLTQEAARRGLASDRKSLQELGDTLDRETLDGWLHQAVCAMAQSLGHSSRIVVDSVRTRKQLEHFRNDHALPCVHVHLFGQTVALRKRFDERSGREAAPEYVHADLIKSEKDIEGFKNDADLRVNTTRNDSRDTMARVAASLGLVSAPDVRCVDVLVGGQYGSEGKGHVVAYLAKEYDVLLRVGGPNAGHTVLGLKGQYTYHHLPSGSMDVNAKLLLGPGMTVFVSGLLKEIADCGVTPERLFIDPNVMVIEQADKDAEARVKSAIASTASGSGAASARRINDRGLSTVRLAKDVPELAPYVGEQEPYRGSTMRQLEIAYRKRQSIFLEGTQGSGLSIFHGRYPHVTSRDTNVAGCLAEAGISPSRVRRILMVVRPTPIRVGDPDGDQGATSGHLKHPTSFREIADEVGLDPEELERNERTSTTRRNRRVGWFEWEQFRQACALNAPTDIVLSFADYLNSKNRDARRFEQLGAETIKFVEELERVAQAPVSLINTRFPRGSDADGDIRTIIDRRNWTARSS